MWKNLISKKGWKFLFRKTKIVLDTLDLTCMWLIEFATFFLRISENLHTFQVFTSLHMGLCNSQVQPQIHVEEHKALTLIIFLILSCFSTNALFVKGELHERKIRAREFRKRVNLTFFVPSDNCTKRSSPVTLFFCNLN